MKKGTAWMLVLLLVISMMALSGCGSKTEDPGPPPAEVINPDGGIGGDVPGENGEAATEGELLENAVTVRIGRDGRKDWAVHMVNNAAAQTMLGYLSGSGLLFPTYTYDGEQGFVAQNVRGSYTRNDETTIADVKAGELYLFSGGQLRFYFKDLEGANITATPVGYYVETEGLTEAVQDAYESNKGDVWGVEVYFVIAKTVD